MKKLLFVALAVFIFSSCTEKNNTTNQDSSIETINNNTRMQLESWENIFLTHPDSLTDEQKAAKKILLPLITESIEIKNNQFHTTLTKEDLKKNNLDPSLYDLLIKNLDEINTGIKKEGLDAQKLYDESIKNLPEN